MSNKKSTFRNTISGLTRELTQEEAEHLNWLDEQMCKQNPYAAQSRWEKVEEK